MYRECAKRVNGEEGMDEECMDEEGMDEEGSLYAMYMTRVFDRNDFDSIFLVMDGG